MSTIAKLARKAGSGALDSDPRPFSKKQKKRRAEYLDSKKQNNINPIANKIKLEHMDSELKSDSMKKYIAKIDAR